MKRKNVILSLVASISVLILVVGLFAVKQFMQWRMLLNSGVFSAAHKDIMEGLLGHIFIWGIIVLVCSLSIILFLCWLLLPIKKERDICEVAGNLSEEDGFDSLRGRYGKQFDSVWSSEGKMSSSNYKDCYSFKAFR